MHVVHRRRTILHRAGGVGGSRLLGTTEYLKYYKVSSNLFYEIAPVFATIPLVIAKIPPRLVGYIGSR